MIAWLTKGAIVDILSNRVAIGWGEHHWSGSEAREGVEFVFPKFFATKEPFVCRFENAATLDKSDLIAELTSWLASERGSFESWAQLKSTEWMEPDKALYETWFQQIQDDLRRGLYQKVVPVVAACAPFRLDPHLIGQLILNALKATGRFAYGLWGAGGGCLGATPESLVQMKAGRVESVALAGTEKLENTSDLETSQKNRIEQQYVTDDLMQTFRELGLEPVASKAEAVQSGELVHIKTTISALSQGLSASDLIKALHPTPALGLYPRQARWREILSRFAFPGRERYGAPFGAIDHTRGESAVWVGIRGVEWSPNQLWLPSGAGHIAGSEMELEWQEMASKRKSTWRALVGESL